MKLYIEEIYLKFTNDEEKIIKLFNNKINIITGNSDTGKSLILQIIDYVLFGSAKKIISTEVCKWTKWYGLKLCVNDKHIFVARGRIENENGSSQYYYSASGEIPNIIESSIDEKGLKEIFENEFSITKETVFPYGGREIRQNSKISFKYFMLFNSLCGDVIDNSTIYFDKQDELRYKEALERIFDLAIGVDDIKNNTLYHKIQQNNEMIDKLQKDISKGESSDSEKDDLFKSIKAIALSKNIIDSKVDDCELIEKLKNLINESSVECSSVNNPNKDYDKLMSEIAKMRIERSKILAYQKKIKQYRDNLQDDMENIKPIELLKPYIENISNPEYESFFKQMEENLSAIKQSLHGKKAFETNFDETLNNLNKKIEEKNQELKKMPNPYDKDNKSIYFYLGILNTNIIKYEKLKLFNKQELENRISDLQDENSELLKQYVDIDDKRKNTIQILEKIVSDYIRLCPVALDDNKHYSASFDYKNKRMNLIDGNTYEIITNTSSSVDLFRHVLNMIGIHSIAIKNNSPFLAPLLILDQPTRPYYNQEKIDILKEDLFKNSNDNKKIKELFDLLSMFVTNLNKSNKDFQLIVFEHIPPTLLSDKENIKFVEIFDGVDNALVPPHIISNK